MRRLGDTKSLRTSGTQKTPRQAALLSQILLISTVSHSYLLSQPPGNFARGTELKPSIRSLGLPRQEQPLTQIAAVTN